jgi:hypothetical protein
MAMDWHDTLMGSVLVISAGLTFAYIKPLRGFCSS